MTDKKTSDTLLVPQQSMGMRRSSLFSRESFHEEMLKKKENNRSVISLAQQPAEDLAAPIRPKVLYENTYRLEPKRKFQSAAAQAIINDNLEKYLKTERYDPNASSQMAKTLSQIIKDAVKELNYDSYKIVCTVTIGQMMEGEVSLMEASRCVWDNNWDTFATGSYKNKELFGVATVYAIYQE